MYNFNNEFFTVYLTDKNSNKFNILPKNEQHKEIFAAVSSRTYGGGS